MSRPWLTSSGWLALLLLVRRGALEPADRRDRREQPGQLGHLGPVALDEQRAAVRIEAEGQQRGGHLARPRPQQDRVVLARQRVVVDDAVDRLVLGLEADVVADRAQVVAEMDDPGRLDPEKMRGRAAGASSGAGAGASSVVMARECSRRRSPRRSLRAVGYHSADVAHPPAPRHERRPRCASACSAPGPSGARSCARCSSVPTTSRPADGAALELVAVAVRDVGRARRRGRARPSSCPTRRRTWWPTTRSTSSSS